MENLNAKQIIKAMECCYDNNLSCIDCPFQGTDKYIECSSLTISALSLIKELTEDKEKLGHLIDELEKEKQELWDDNKKLTRDRERLRNRITCSVTITDEQVEEIKAHCLERIELDIKAVQADTVREMQERLKAKVNADIDRCYMLGISVAGPLSLFLDEIDETAKEMIENG